MGTRASGSPSWPGVRDSTEGRIHLRRPPLPSFVFRLQLCGGPYIPISRLLRHCIPFKSGTVNRDGCSPASYSIRKKDESGTYQNRH